MQISLRQILPLAIAMLTQVSMAFGQLGEGGTDGPEPQVILPDNSHSVPIRMASREITESTDSLVKFVWETREAQRRRLLSTEQHTPWQIMHGLLGLRQDFLISHGGKPVNGLEWIYSGPTYQNEAWFQKTPHGGRAHPFSKPYWFEGHINQFLAILSMCNVPLDQQFATPNGPITMRDMLKNAQMTVNAKEEVTWTLWALSTYLPPDATWVNAAGEQWSIEKLVQIETGKKVGGPTSPCGGTHGLFALARARNVYLRTGKPLRGAWLEADQKVKRYIETAKMLRNNDGSLSSGFFKQKEYKQDFDKRMASEGHVLEFLMMAVSQEQLKEPWVRKAIETTANDLMANRKAYVSCSPLYHATNALSIYLDRVAPTGVQEMAKKPENATSVSNSKTLGPATAQKPGPVPAVPKIPTATPSAAGSAAPVNKPAATVTTESNSQAPAPQPPAGTAPAPAAKPTGSETKSAMPVPQSTDGTSAPAQLPAPGTTPANVAPKVTSADTPAATAPAATTPAAATPALKPTPGTGETPATPVEISASKSPTMVMAVPAEPQASAGPVDSVKPEPAKSAAGPVSDERFDRIVNIVVMPQPLSSVFRSVSQSEPVVESTLEKTTQTAPATPVSAPTEPAKSAPEPKPPATTSGPAITPAPTSRGPAMQPNGNRRTWRPSNRQTRTGMNNGRR